MNTDGHGWEGEVECFAAVAASVRPRADLSVSAELSEEPARNLPHPSPLPLAEGEIDPALESFQNFESLLDDGRSKPSPWGAG